MAQVAQWHRHLELQHPQDFPQGCGTDDIFLRQILAACNMHAKVEIACAGRLLVVRGPHPLQ